jgi:ferredoxin
MNGPATYRIVLETPDGEFSFECRADEVIWDAAARHGISLPAICHQGWCLTCAARILSGAVDQSLSRGYFPRDKEEGYALPCTARPRSDVRLRTHQQSMMREYRRSVGLPAPYSH